MYDLGALAGAQVIAEALDMYQWENHWRRMREQDGLASQNAFLLSEIHRLSASYNRLVADYRRLANAAIEAGHDAEQQIAELRREVAAFRADKEARDEEVKFLRALDNMRARRDGFA